MRSGAKKTASLLAVFFCVWFSLRFLLPLFSPFLLGFSLALAAEPTVALLQRRMHLPRGISAGIGVSITFGLLAVVLLLICAFLVRELGYLAGVLPDLEDTARSGLILLQNWLLRLTAHTPRSIQPLLRQNVTELFSDGTTLLNRAATRLLALAGNLLSHIPDSALGLGTAIISGYMFSAKLPQIRRWLLRRFSREKLQRYLSAFRRIRRAVGCWLLAQCKLMGVTFLILLSGLLLLRIPNALLWALGISLVDAFPVLGTGTVLLPWSLICFLQQDFARTAGLLGIYTTVTLIRSVLEPRLIGRHLGLDPLVTLMALYAGYKLWGIGGMILAPVLTVTAFQLFPEHRRRESG